MDVRGVERRVLEEIAAGDRSLEALLDLICELVQDQLEPSVVSLMLIAEDGLLYVSAGPSIPPALKVALDGLEPNPTAGNCSVAVYTGRPAYVCDTALDPSWDSIQDLAETFGIGSCWSHPIRVRGEVLGSFAVSHPAPRAPSEDDKVALGVFASLAAVAIRADEARVEGQRREIELQRALRLESLGLFAGELAHDFNNLLVGILGGLELAVDPAFADSSLEHVEGARVAAHEAAALCRRFRSLAGTQTEPQPTNLETLVSESVQLARGVVQSVDVRWQPAGEMPEIQASPTQLRQLILNLIVNGSEAMSGKGVLRLSVETGWRSARYLRGCQIGAHLPPATYLTLAVEDEGAGFSSEALSSAFEPFFSTKPAQEEARGLGLASVAKVAQAHGGAIRISTTPEGTRIEALFPAPRALNESPAEARILVVGPAGPEREAIVAALGAKTQSADCPEEGETWWSEDGPFDLLVLDLRCGWGLYEVLRVRDRHCRAILIGDEEDLLTRVAEYADPHPVALCRPWDVDALKAACERALSLQPRAVVS
ncbi:MAG: GAF domain-containing protein [Planctomycetes bacterium]|nr:GAF domain-containing protein [Planctomycetota bacterium]